MKRKAENAIISKIQDEYEAAIYENCGFTLVGQNALGKILIELRDAGTIHYNIKYPLFFEGVKITVSSKIFR